MIKKIDNFYKKICVSPKLKIIKILNMKIINKKDGQVYHYWQWMKCIKYIQTILIVLGKCLYVSKNKIKKFKACFNQKIEVCQTSKEKEIFNKEF